MPTINVSGNAVSAIVFAVLVFAAASSGGLFKPGEWYESLRKPPWTPPKWAFPVVWTILYVMIAYSGWLVWEEGLITAVWLWGAQLVCNALWSFFFFGRKMMRVALADMLLMLAFISAYIAVTMPVIPLAGWLFVPYAIWVIIAGTLNWSVLQLNPQER